MQTSIQKSSRSSNFIKQSDLTTPIKDTLSYSKAHLLSNPRELLEKMKDQNVYESVVISNIPPSYLDQLINTCTKKLEQEPYNLKSLFVRASSYLKKNKTTLCMKDCLNLLKHDPGHIGANYLKGCVFQKAEQIQDAIDSYNLVLKLDPQHVNAILARASCFNKMVSFWFEKSQCFQNFNQFWTDFDEEFRENISKRQMTTSKD